MADGVNIPLGDLQLALAGITLGTIKKGSTSLDARFSDIVNPTQAWSYAYPARERPRTMPVCFQLTRKSELDKGPVSLNQIDREICAVMELPEHPTRYCLGWFDVIGFALAMGRTFETIDDMLSSWVSIPQHGLHRDHDLTTINNYLRDNFTADGWRETKH